MLIGKKAVKGKGNIPYSWLSKSRMKHRFLPPLNEWVDDLYGELIKQQDLDRYNKIFSDYNCHTYCRRILLPLFNKWQIHFDGHHISFQRVVSF
jgi:hypothetical protein